MRKENPRMDVASRVRYPKTRLFRLVSDNGVLTLDDSNSLPGRGVYLLKSKESILLAKKRHLLSRYGHIEDEEGFYQMLLTLVGEE